TTSSAAPRPPVNRRRLMVVLLPSMVEKARQALKCETARRATKPDPKAARVARPREDFVPQASMRRRERYCRPLTQERLDVGAQTRDPLAPLKDSLPTAASTPPPLRRFLSPPPSATPGAAGDRSTLGGSGRFWGTRRGTPAPTHLRARRPPSRPT